MVKRETTPPRSSLFVITLRMASKMIIFKSRSNVPEGWDPRVGEVRWIRVLFFWVPMTLIPFSLLCILTPTCPIDLKIVARYSLLYSVPSFIGFIALAKLPFSVFWPTFEITPDSIAAVSSAHRMEILWDDVDSVEAFEIDNECTFRISSKDKRLEIPQSIPDYVALNRLVFQLVRTPSEGRNQVIESFSITRELLDGKTETHWRRIPYRKFP